jgi:NAD(P)-dependent dehydrogenase (short-subunit alcohol dehydrogenase family)
MDLNLKGKTAIVTGGNTGIGSGICEVLAGEGMNVIVTYIIGAPEALAFARKLTEQFGTKCTAVFCDITNTDDIDAVYALAEKEYGHADVLVNNAGIWPTTPIAEMPDAEWKKVIDVNLNGTYLFSKRACMHYIKHGVEGHVVNMSSKSGFAVTSPDHAHYATAKGALTLMVKAMAREFTPKGITINGVAPGMVRTPFNEDKLSQPEWLKYYQDRIPVGRISTAHEVAYTVAFLASEKARFITGAIVDVTGGMLI